MKHHISIIISYYVLSFFLFGKIWAKHKIIETFFDDEYDKLVAPPLITEGKALSEGYGPNRLLH